MNERERRDILIPEVRVNKWFKLEAIQRALLSQSSVALYRRWIAFFRFCSSPHNTRGDQHPSPSNSAALSSLGLSRGSIDTRHCLAFVKPEALCELDHSKISRLFKLADDVLRSVSRLCKIQYRTVHTEDSDQRGQN